MNINEAGTADSIRSEGKIHQAFVLGAGLGTRLRSLTRSRPKPLIPVANRPLITCAFDHLIANGIKRLVVNTHYRAEHYARIFPDSSYRSVPLHFRHEDELLETGGGIKNVEDLLNSEPFVVYNGDILTTLPLENAIAHHLATANEVTMVLRSKNGPLQVSFDHASGAITDIGRRIHPEIPSEYLFTGVYIVSPEFLSRLPARTKISVIPIFLQMIQRSRALGGIVLDDGVWWDLGSREQYLAVHRHFARQENPAVPMIHPEARIEPGAQLNGACALGPGAVVGAGAVLTDCVLWENAVAAPNCRLERCIISAEQRAEGVHSDIDF